MNNRANIAILLLVLLSCGAFAAVTKSPGRSDNVLDRQEDATISDLEQVISEEVEKEMAAAEEEEEDDDAGMDDVEVWVKMGESSASADGEDAGEVVLAPAGFFRRIGRAFSRVGRGIGRGFRQLGRLMPRGNYKICLGRCP
ncbi:unnamed protein product [Mesocestoides corti]|uniref:Uncharacterized protein n=1 Tax=Mesocestoides corti TaxID=53468 RepID=A0A0R3U4Y6_MESCO|nr:unnamed protein product [Mesocestoides corti]